MSATAQTWTVIGLLLAVLAGLEVRGRRNRRKREIQALRRQEQAREAAYARHPFTVMGEELAAEWDRLAPLYEPADAGRSDRWAK